MLHSIRNHIKSEKNELRELKKMKFGIGQPVTRKEDPKFLTGRGRYVGDITDALGIDDIKMPATPERVWRAIQY
jgi:CO/xanthine dehydrogenase Mo-binding subunit